MKIMLIILSSMLFTALVSAADKTTQPATTTAPSATVAKVDAGPSIKGTASTNKFEDVILSSSVEVNYNGQHIALKPVSHGIRKKKVFGLATVSVYVLEFFSAKPEKLVKTETDFLPSVKNTEATQFKLTLLRDLSGQKIYNSFLDSLKNNKVDIENPSKELKLILDEIQAVPEFKTNETFTITTLWKDGVGSAGGTATMIIQKPDGSLKTIQGPNEFAMNIHSIWFGSPVDEKAIELKKVLIK